MPLYLDPKNDLIFKKIFGEHPDLLISFLNALMPFPAGRQIKSVEYLPAELVPDTPIKKNSIVDVRCTDNYKRQFIVEMQMFWSTVFNKRLVFNATKAYSRQLEKGEHFKLLQPVYGLGILNDTFDVKTPEFYHHYRIINRQHTDEVLEGLEFVLVELPKFKPEKWTDRKMAVLWLRFLKEMEECTTTVSDDLLEDEYIRQAVDMCEKAAFTPAERECYEQYWLEISYERSLADASYDDGMEKGLAEGLEKGMKEGMREGMKEGKREGMEQVVVKSFKKGFSVKDISDLTELDEEEILHILQKNKLL
ncbi:MAG: Rpn family recombination-promoting nuclease/putative transposase [Bacteroidales bacterium]|jgi:predicted transposase/invertase (TIGR01784 family)|nr:Rpn family recombination-promoting nuclease/putative transposase [Bacteroidales bacterium]